MESRKRAEATEAAVAAARRLVVAEGEDGVYRFTFPADNHVWRIRIPDGLENREVAAFDVADNECHLAVRTKERGAMNVELYTYKRGTPECTWHQHVVTHFDEKAILGSNTTCVFIKRGEASNDVVVFSLLSTSFAIDVLSRRSGERTACFASMFPRLMR
jgi:hypothetical protein